MNHAFTYHLNSIPVLVTGQYTAGQIGTHEDPPFHPCFEVIAVEYKGVNIIDIITENQLYDIQERGIETY